MKVYVGCALTYAPTWFKVRIEELKSRLREIPGVEVLEFLGLTNGTARDVYVHDIVECVGGCDLMVAICDHPSIGLGWEMATQVGRGKPLLAFAHKGMKVTRLIQDPGLPGYQYIWYDNFDQVYEKIRAELVRNHLAA